MLTKLWCYRLEVDNLDKLVMIMKIWSVDARLNYAQEQSSINEFLKENANIIDEVIHF